MQRLLLALAIALGITACAEPPEPTSREGTEIAARSDTWDAAFSAGDLDTLVGLYAEDTRLLPPDGEMLTGREAVRAAFGEMIGSGFGGELTTIETRIAADIAYHVGSYVTTDADGTVVDRGKFMETWQLRDGEWLITNDIWNSDMAPAPMPAERHASLSIIHEVEDPERWLAAWQGEDSRRELFRQHGARHVHVFQNAENPKVTGLVVALDDMEAFQAFMESEEAEAAKAQDGVISETMQLFMEVH